jgi:L-alanine-DL-glutamate epimerase-like enolase superfamily enzyme
MGEAPAMQRRFEEKLEAGFSCLKLKIGALNFEEELRLLRGLRRNFSAERLELRVDANGAFSPEEAPGVLAQLADLHIHSIEQPIAAGQWQEMARLCEESPLPIALDEELIGLHKEVLRLDMLNTIRPHFLILKPSLTGGFASSNHWIQLARKMGSDYWVTSALESNVGLNAIAQWTATLNNPLPQGLGTGQVFTNNVDSPLYLQGSRLYYEAGEGGLPA